MSKIFLKQDLHKKRCALFYLNHLKLKNAGFTLLEVFFVIAILAAIAVAGITLYQQRLFQIKVDKTVLQMQNIAQAGLSYYSKENTWPNNIGELVTKEYLLPSSVTSPWNANYTIENSSHLFKVHLVLPVQYNNGAKIASMIAARLPMSEVQGTTVTAAVSELVLGGGNSALQNIHIIDSPNMIIDKPHCAEGYEPKLAMAVNNLEVDTSPTTGSLLPLRDITLSANDNPLNENQWKPQLIIRSGATGLGKITAIGISYCAKKTS